MVTSNVPGSQPGRKRIRLAIPNFDTGLTPVMARVSVDRQLEAIEIAVLDDGGAKLLLTEAATIDLILRLCGCVFRLQKIKREIAGDEL